MKLHLRAYGDMGKRKAFRTFCQMTGKMYEVTEYATLVTCKKCLDKILVYPTKEKDNEK